MWIDLHVSRHVCLALAKNELAKKRIITTDDGVVSRIAPERKKRIPQIAKENICSRRRPSVFLSTLKPAQ